MKKRIIVIVFFVLLFGVSAMVYWGQRKDQLEEMYYSGTIEAKQANLSFQVSGRVIDVHIDEGQSVEKDQPLAVLDQSELLTLRDQAKATLKASRSNLQQFKLNLEIDKTVLPVEVERAESGVRALRSTLDELRAGYRVQDIEKAHLALLASETALEVARKDKERYDRLLSENIVSEKERDAVYLRHNTALREYESAGESFDQLNEGFREESIRYARARVMEGEAILKQAKSNLKKIEVSKKKVEAAGANVEAAEAALKLTETQLSFTQIRAPFKGIIAGRNVEPGEVVSPGREVLSLSDLSSVDLKIFVDETEIGKVKPGQRVDVKVDTFPEKIYQGKVSFISPEGEFTPKIIQTHKERVKLVYLVKVLLPNPDHELKPGMPADAWLR
ncbi:HlyD family secretion protein [Thermodesulfobacteriota bacterium]